MVVGGPGAPTGLDSIPETELLSPGPVVEGSLPDAADGGFEAGRRRFVVAVVIGLVVVTIPFLWILWDLWTGSTSLFRQYSPDNFYDLQGRAILAGHLWIPNGSIGIEAFVHDGRSYTYFGIFPSLIRLPILALTHRFDGRLTAPSMLLAWMVTGLFSSLLLWRVRILARGEAMVSWAEAVCSGVAVAAVTGGSVLMYLAASPKVSDEDIAWSVALTIASLFALLGVLERPSWARVVGSGVLVVATALNRSPTGYACAAGAVLVAGWFAFGRSGRENRKWALSMSLVGLIAFAANGLINWLKLGMPFGLSEADQVWTQVNAHRRLYMAANGGNAFGLRFLPSTLRVFLNPVGIHFQSAFPYLTLPTSPPQTVGNVIFDATYPTFGLPVSMPLSFLLACWGLITAFRPHSIGRIRLCRVLLVASAAATAGFLLFGYIANRYLGDVLPFLALAGFIGLCDVWRRLDGRGSTARILATLLICLGGLFGVWANVGSAITPSALWTPAQSLAFVSRQYALGHSATERLVRVGDRLPYFAPAGTIFAMSDCSGLYVSTGFSYATVPGQQLQHETWNPVLQGPGIVNLAQVDYLHTVRPGDPSLTVLTWGATTVRLVPSGVDTVRTVIDNPGGPPGVWPPTSTGPQAIKPGTPFTIEVITDPNLQSITAGGLGGGLVHYLAGSGPAVVNVTTPGDAGFATVQDVSQPAPSMALCHQMIAGSGDHA